MWKNEEVYTEYKPTSFCKFAAEILRKDANTILFIKLNIKILCLKLEQKNLMGKYDPPLIKPPPEQRNNR